MIQKLSCEYYEIFVYTFIEHLWRLLLWILILWWVNLSSINHSSANPTKWSNTLKQFIGNLSMNWLIVFDHFVGLALKRLTISYLLFSSKESWTETETNRSKRYINKILCMNEGMFINAVEKVHVKWYSHEKFCFKKWI